MPALLATAKVATLPDISIGHSLLQMAIALGVVVAAIWGLSKVLARLRGGASTAKRRAATGGLSIVSRQSLGKDLAIATVRWGEREVLVGIAGSTITFLDDAKGGAPGIATGPDDAERGPAQEMPVDILTARRLAEQRSHPLAPVVQRPAGQRRDAGRPGAQHSLIDALRDATARR